MQLPTIHLSSFFTTALITLLLCASGCATFFSGARQKVTISSNVTGAKVQVNGIDRGITPLTLKLKRGYTGQIVTLSAHGYETKIFQPEVNFNAATLGNIIFLPGFGIDLLTGAMWKYHPKQFTVELVPIK